VKRKKQIVIQKTSSLSPPKTFRLLATIVTAVVCMSRLTEIDWCCGPTIVLVSFLGHWSSLALSMFLPVFCVSVSSSTVCSQVLYKEGW
jgi:hypothetical protein